MKSSVFPSLKNYKLKYLPYDLFSGIIVAAITIPISMGYAQVCGLPAVYGLYGAVFPTLFFAMLSSSPQLVFGVDAAPCAIVGGLIASLGITAGSQEAITIIPAITLFAGIWLMLLYFLKAGRLVNFVSVPVMGGFISGIAVTIIMMQFPKLIGGTVGEGEFIELSMAIYTAFKNPNWLSFAMGLGAVVIITLSRKFVPKFPMAVVMMVLGAVSTTVFNVQDYGVKLLDHINSGLPNFSLPNIDYTQLNHIIGTSITIAIVIFAETLLAENNFAMKNDYKIDDNREILAFSIANVVSAFTGGVPINGSVSRTVMSEQFGGKSQLVSVVSGFSMIFVLLFCTDLISWLPVPVLTGIVISALISVIEFDIAKRLIKTSRVDAVIFFSAFFGVLLLGTIYGVIIGTVLSFVAVILRAVNPQRTFLGVIPDREGFFNLKRNMKALPIKGVLLYRFSGNLFFANISIFQEDIESHITDDTKAVIVQARGITHIDITAADRLGIIYRNLQKRGIRFYITEHIGAVNDLLRQYGLGYLIDEQVCKRQAVRALEDCGIYPPYVTTHCQKDEFDTKNIELANRELHEYEWAYGKDAEKMMNSAVTEIISDIKYNKEMSISADELGRAANISVGKNTVIEDEILMRLEMHIEDISKATDKSEEELVTEIEKRREKIRKHIKKYHLSSYAALNNHRDLLMQNIKESDPQLYKIIMDANIKNRHKSKHAKEKNRNSK